MSNQPPTEHKDSGDALDLLLSATPRDDVPRDLWEKIGLNPTWTGLWIDGWGEWDEEQVSDVFPIDDLLSQKRRDWFIAGVRDIIAAERTQLIQEIEEAIGPDEAEEAPDGITGETSNWYIAKAVHRNAERSRIRKILEGLR